MVSEGIMGVSLGYRSYKAFQEPCRDFIGSREIKGALNCQLSEHSKKRIKRLKWVFKTFLLFSGV